MRRIIYTADDEEPDCGRCDHVCDSDNLCMDYCGPEHGWARYVRTDLVMTDRERRHDDGSTMESGCTT